MKRTDIAVFGSAIAGCIACSVAAWVSVSGATGKLPPWLFGSSTPSWTTYRFVAGVPVELLGAASFGGLIILTLIGRKFVRTGAYSLLFASAVVLLGLGLGLLSRIPGSVPLALGTAFAGIIACVTAASDDTPPLRIPSRVVSELRSLFSRSAPAVILMAYLMAIAILTQQVSFAVQATSREQSSASNLLRWFATQRGRAVPALGPQPGQLNVVIFSDYQCPTCAALVPEYVRVLAPLRTEYATAPGRKQVSVAVKDFPLDSKCNPAVRLTTHAVACESAAAVRLIRRLKGDALAAEFERWLYAHHDGLTNDALMDQLDSHGVKDTYMAQSQALLDEIRRDVSAALSAGVSSTPSVFIDGIKMPQLTPSALETLVTTLVTKSQ
jgi:protein-disulfide isomerase